MRRREEARRNTAAFLPWNYPREEAGEEAEAQREFDQCLKIDPTLRPELEEVERPGEGLEDCGNRNYSIATIVMTPNDIVHR
jgi:hypothetical protein